MAGDPSHSNHMTPAHDVEQDVGAISDDAVHAHPDDESITTGGTIAMLVAAGAAATLTVRADFATLPPEAMTALLSCDDDTWSAAYVGPAGIRVGGAAFPPPRESGTP